VADRDEASCFRPAAAAAVATAAAVTAAAVATATSGMLTAVNV